MNMWFTLVLKVVSRLFLLPKLRGKEIREDKYSKHFVSNFLTKSVMLFWATDGVKALILSEIIKKNFKKKNLTQLRCDYNCQNWYIVSNTISPFVRSTVLKLEWNNIIILLICKNISKVSAYVHVRIMSPFLSSLVSGRAVWSEVVQHF